MKDNKPKSVKTLKKDLEFLEDLKTRWMATVDAIADPLMIVDKDFFIKKSNQAMAEFSKSGIRDVIGKKCFEVFAGTQRPCSGCKVLEIYKNAKSEKVEFEQTIKGRFHEIVAQPLYNSAGDLDGVLTIYRDRSEKIEMQNRLLQAEKMASIGLLAGGIAHEINNPLGGILIFSQMVLREMNASDPHYVDMVEIEAAAQRCKGIIQNLLDFARANPASEEELSYVDIQDAMLAALNFVMVGNHRREITVEQEWDVLRLSFRGNPNKVIQAFLNLIQNAVQAMPRGGVLTLRSVVTVHNEQDAMCYEIEDTGIGIEASEITKIFDPFYTSKGVGEGTGLGLSICHGIVKDMHGDIEVVSRKGESTLFRIYLPMKLSRKAENQAS